MIKILRLFQLLIFSIFYRQKTNKKIYENANVSSQNIINNANVIGFKDLCHNLNITNTNEVIRLNKILNLLENPASKLFFNIANNVIIDT